MDNTQLPGILPTVSYLEWPPETAATVAAILARKLGREPYVPPRLSVSPAIAPIASPESLPATVTSKSGKRGEHAEDALLQTYIREIEEKYDTGNARELSYRLALETLLKKLVPEITVTHEPARKTYGTPDYVISQKTGHGLLTIGYYAEFLKIDFPRLPLTSNADLFRKLCKPGAGLVKLHLMEQIADSLPAYPQKGNNVVDAVRYTEPGQGWPSGRVWINKEQYFEGVAPEVWDFHVGGYQVCQKWLKDRKARALSYEDIEHYEGIVANLAQTIILMQQIDEIIDAYGGWPIG